MNQSRASITVETMSSGYSIRVGLHQNTMEFPAVMITYDFETSGTQYIVELEDNKIFAEENYEVALDKVKGEMVCDFLQVAELIHRQKQERMQGESWRDVVDDILTL